MLIFFLFLSDILFLYRQSTYIIKLLRLKKFLF